jgi:hypothetical protein
MVALAIIGVGANRMAPERVPHFVDRVLGAFDASTGSSASAQPLPRNPCSPAPTACRRSSGSKTISGTVRGADGRFVDVMLGFDIIDASGHKIRADGKPVTEPGYGAIQRLNYCVPSTGAAHATATCGGTRLSDRWSQKLPSNASIVYIEAYPKAPTPGNWLKQDGYSGPDPGKTDQRTYGMSYRRAVPVGGSGASGLQLLLPAVCGRSGGSTGEIWGQLYRDGKLWKAKGGSTNAWATSDATSRLLGMGVGRVDPRRGTYRIRNLHAGSRYTIVAAVDGLHRQWLGRQPTVRACSATRFDLYF